ncbi:DODA-type extradiol aromatic ring-opening family dioxygenase [Stappia indica]|uniref:DODA-type extradiol aromatic ring-opening family dioxygenase n=1 Tax=Stappia indica TaxID=538381 RepID=UPI001CD6047A|nr:protocatechuate 3,4-dioxygenase [Stappia indica]MCA1300482.1 protocatechuate 3,4-dioxygenase [Stappia indica]
MATIVGGFVVPHNPVMYFNPKGASAEQSAAVYAAYARMAERIRELRADTAIIIGCDHYILFGTEALPPYVISTGEIEGPVDQLPGIKRAPIASNAALGAHIAAVGRQTGFDWTVGRAMQVDHSIGIPHHLMIKPNAGMTSVAVMLACGVDPYLPMARAWQIGEHIAAAVESDGTDQRVVVIGSGGISHHVGNERMGEVNPTFDRKVLGIVTRGDREAMLALTDEEILQEGGNGAMEIRTYACAMAATRAAGGEVVAYEPIEGWVTGMGFAELKVAA